jgi:hypothetical protein
MIYMYIQMDYENIHFLKFFKSVQRFYSTYYSSLDKQLFKSTAFAGCCYRCNSFHLKCINFRFWLPCNTAKRRYRKTFACGRFASHIVHMWTFCGAYRTWYVLRRVCVFAPHIVHNFCSKIYSRILQGYLFILNYNSTRGSLLWLVGKSVSLLKPYYFIA